MGQAAIVLEVNVLHIFHGLQVNLEEHLLASVGHVAIFEVVLEVIVGGQEHVLHLSDRRHTEDYHTLKSIPCETQKLTRSKRLAIG